MISREVGYQARKSSVSLGQPMVENGHRPELNQVSRTSGSCSSWLLPQVAQALNLSRADVHGVLTFYHDFRTEPPGRHVLKLCRAESCQSMGCEELAKRALARVPEGWGGTTADGALTIEAAFCLGLCACSPAAMLDGAPLGRLDPARLDALLVGLE